MWVGLMLGFMDVENQKTQLRTSGDIKACSPKGKGIHAFHLLLYGKESTEQRQEMATAL